ncbi:MAG: FGGY-family carbohydrate kinase [Proteobacteria bacterium]|nr:FGGY-family carbohydrate kinase [Pseudomonadota bacterium]
MPELPTPLALGLDLGTSALKAALVDATGQVLAQASADIATVSDSPGQAEQDPQAWLAAAAGAVAALSDTAAAELSAGRIRAIGLAGQLPTLVMLGGSGPVGPAITWKDARADESAQALIGTRREELYGATGMPIDGRYLAPMFRLHHRPGAAVRQILSAKDYLCHALTGALVTDPSTAAGYGLYELASGAFSGALCALWGVPVALLPAVRPAHAVAAPLSASGAQLLRLPAGIPVSVGAADSMSGAYAMGSLAPGRVCIAMGSSTIILDAARERRLDPQRRYLLSPHVKEGWYAREMDLLATGTGWRWLCGLFQLSAAALAAEAARAPAGAGGALFMPYLAGGEQGALWNPALRGAVAGLSLNSGRAELARAFLEGVSFEIRRCVEVLAETQPVTEVVLAGGFAQSPFAMQLLANVLRLPVRSFPEVSPAAQGAALGALEAIGSPAAPSEAALGRPVHPDAEAATYTPLYERYLKVSAACA